MPNSRANKILNRMVALRAMVKRPRRPTSLFTKGRGEALILDHRLGLSGSVLDEYEFLEMLGTGTQGSVAKARQIKTGELRAIKVISKVSDGNPLLEIQLRREIQALKRLDHVNVCKLFEIYEDSNAFYLVLELCTGGDLFHHVTRETTLTEHVAADIMKQLISCISYLHGKGIIHRDLKPENVLYLSDSPHSPMKIIDFGFSMTVKNAVTPSQSPGGASGPIVLTDASSKENSTASLSGDSLARGSSPLHKDSGEDYGNSGSRRSKSKSMSSGGGTSSSSGSAGSNMLRERITGLIGTPYYLAPEIIQGMEHGPEMDIWALGVILYILLGGYPPFYGDSTAEVLTKIASGVPVEFPDKWWGDISFDAKDLILKMLNRDVHHRITSIQALEHPWLIKNSSRRSSCAEMSPESQKRTANSLSGLKKFCGQNKLRKVVVSAIAYNICGSEDTQIQELRKVFQALDTDKSGTLSLAEFRQGMKVAGIADDSVEKMFEELDTDGTGQIDYTEFIAAAMDKATYSRHDLCWQAFRIIDRSQDGLISCDELEAVLGTGILQDYLGTQSIKDVINEVDLNKDGMIDFDEFVTMMTRSSVPRTGINEKLGNDTDEDELETTRSSSQVPNSSSSNLLQQGQSDVLVSPPVSPSVVSTSSPRKRLTIDLPDPL